MSRYVDECNSFSDVVDILMAVPGLVMDDGRLPMDPDEDVQARYLFSYCDCSYAAVSTLLFEQLLPELCRTYEHSVEFRVSGSNPQFCQGHILARRSCLPEFKVALGCVLGHLARA